MKKIILAIAAVSMLAACSRTEKTAAIGAVSGAVIGGIVSNDWRGAAVGAAAGGAAGAIIGRTNEPNKCYYRDRYGRRYVDRC